MSCTGSPCPCPGLETTKKLGVSEYLLEGGQQTCAPAFFLPSPLCSEARERRLMASDQEGLSIHAAKLCDSWYSGFDIWIRHPGNGMRRPISGSQNELCMLKQELPELGCTAGASPGPVRPTSRKGP